MCHPQNVMKSEITIHPRITGGCWWTGGFPPILHPPGGGSYSNSIARLNQRQQTRSATMQNQLRVCCVYIHASMRLRVASFTLLFELLAVLEEAQSFELGGWGPGKANVCLLGLTH